MANKNILSNLLKSINNPFASILDDGCIYDNMELISTGNYLFNAQISGSMFGGFPSNKIFILAGEQATGKTFILLNTLREYLNSNSKHSVVLFETEGAIDKKLIQKRGLDPSRIMIVPISSVEEFKKQSIQLITALNDASEEDRPKILMALDSIGMLASEKEVEDALAGKTVQDMTRAKTFKSAFRILTLSLARNNIPLIATNHTYQTIGGFIAKKSMGGGSAAYFSASAIAFLGKGQVKDDGVLTGTRVFCSLEKSRMTREKTKIEFDIDFCSGIDPYSGLFDFCLKAKLVKMKGKKYHVDNFPDNEHDKKTILSNPSILFTPESMKWLDTKMKEIFEYGSYDGVEIENFIESDSE